MTAFSEILHHGLPRTQASKALILLHGRGGTAQSILSLADRLCDRHFYIAAPQAVNHTWYPHSFMEEEALNEPFLSSSVKSIQDLIAQIAQHIPQEHIFLAGFSQGACLSLEAPSRSAATFGGIVAFTGGLIGKTLDKAKYRGNFAGTKILITNGDDDPHIPLSRSQQSQELLENLGARITLKVYKDRPHTITQDELNTARREIFNLHS